MFIRPLEQKTPPFYQKKCKKNRLFQGLTGASLNAKNTHILLKGGFFLNPNTAPKFILVRWGHCLATTCRECIITEWSGVSGACKGSFLPGIETAQKV